MLPDAQILNVNILINKFGNFSVTYNYKYNFYQSY